MMQIYIMCSKHHTENTIKKKITKAFQASSWQASKISFQHYVKKSRCFKACQGMSTSPKQMSWLSGLLNGWIIENLLPPNCFFLKSTQLTHLIFLGNKKDLNKHSNNIVTLTFSFTSNLMSVSLDIALFFSSPKDLTKLSWCVLLVHIPIALQL